MGAEGSEEIGEEGAVGGHCVDLEECSKARTREYDREQGMDPFGRRLLLLESAFITHADR